MNLTLYFLTGASASGKTDLSLDWSLANEAEILSCDSLLFYRGMDIGTAKPTGEQRLKVRHHGIDICSLRESFNVADYVKFSQSAIADIRKRGKNVLVVGGSGFYLKSFFSPVVDDLKISGEIVQQAQSLYDAGGLEGLTRELKRLNPDGCGSLDWQNPRRVFNSLQRCLASGKTVIQLNREFDEKPIPFPHFKKLVCCLWREKEDTKSRVVRRVRQMLRQGLLDEVRGLLDEGIVENPSAASAIGYRECIEYLKGGGNNLADLEDNIVRNTMRLVKKQRTWFKKHIPVDRWLFLDKNEKGQPESLFN